MKAEWRQFAALLKKYFREKRERDRAGRIFRLIVAGLLGGAFAYFFARFLSVYASIPTAGAPARTERLYESFTLVFAFLLVSLTVGGVRAIVKELFSGEHAELFSAYPVRLRTLFLSKLTALYAEQFLFCLAATLLAAVAAGTVLPQGAGFYFAAAGASLALPVVSGALASALTLPCYAVLRFLQPRFALTFALVTALTALGVWGYSALLGAVKELLLGDELRYFFTEKVMSAIGRAAGALYPANLLAGLVARRRALRCGLWLLLLVLACAAVFFTVMRGLTRRSLGAKARSRLYFYGGRRLPKRHSAFFALMKKEFLQIFRSPSDAFSYFSVALVMPLMVYFCLSVGDSLVKRLIGLDCAEELSLLLTLLYGALTNVFCATNVSREGSAFRAVKATPVSAGKIFGAKVLFCLLVSALSQGVSASLVCGAGFLSPVKAGLLFVCGTVFSFGQICFATGYDLSHADRYGDGESSAAVVSLLGMLSALFIGGSVFLLKLNAALRGGVAVWSAAVASGAAAVLAAIGAWSLFFGLDRRYGAFTGGAA